MATDESFPVLIVGGGIVGLSASLFLSFHGVKSLLVERHASTSIHPRARGFNCRTMELYRGLGLDEAIRTAGAELNPSNGIYKGSTLAEVIESKPRTKEGTDRTELVPFSGLLQRVSPSKGTRGTQDLVEPVLLAAARERGGDLRLNTECISVQQDESGITATVRERGSEAPYTVHADYLIAADGAGSRIRKMLDINLTGQGALGNLLNILFYADLRELVRGREFSLCLIDRPEMHGLFTAINNSDKWVFHLSYDPEKGEKPADYTIPRVQSLIKTALGMPEVSIEIKSILPWQSSAWVAETLQRGRIFLAGDAAHQMTPYRGLGATTGVADVHNLAWKLAAVLNGRAGLALLETYNSERLPVGNMAASESGAAADERGLLAWDWTVVPKILRCWPIIPGFGYRYASKAVIAADLSHFLRIPWYFYSWAIGLDGKPGTRIPHMWVQDHGQHVSTLDLCKTDFVLLAGSEGRSWQKAASAVSARMGIHIGAYRLGLDGDTVTSKIGDWESLCGISASGALLVRPDQFIAWRAYREPENLDQKLEEVMIQILSR